VVVRALALSLLLAALLAPRALAGSADLRIMVWPQGKDKGRSVSWTLRCDPTGGTLPQPARACRLLKSLRSPFAPVPPTVACSQIYGGPQVALVRGTFQGRRVWATFTRTDGCQTERWNRVAFLFRSG